MPNRIVMTVFTVLLLACLLTIVTEWLDMMSHREFIWNILLEVLKQQWREC